jgi:hypothetical protein
MMKYRLLLLIAFLAFKLQAADYLDPARIVVDIFSHLSAAAAAADQDASLASSSPLSKIFTLQELIQPILPMIFGVELNSSEPPADGASTGAKSTTSMLNKLLESKGIGALLEQQNIISRSSTNIKYAVRENFCAAIRNDTGLSETNSSICEKLVRQEKIFIDIANNSGQIAINILWGDEQLAIIKISANSVYKSIDLGTTFKLLKKINPDFSLENLSGHLGLEYNFSTPSKAANCKNEARSCLSVLANKIAINGTENSMSIDGLDGQGRLITVEVSNSGKIKLYMMLDSLKFSLSFLSLSVNINQLKTTILADKNRIILDNFSKGEGWIDFGPSRISLDINHGKNMPSIEYFQPENSQEATVTMDPATLEVTIDTPTDGLKEILSVNFTSPNKEPVKIKFGSSSCDTNAIQNKNISQFQTINNKDFQADCFFFLSTLLEGAISNTAEGADLGVDAGRVEVDYKYGEVKEKDSPNWYGFIKFVLAQGEYLRKIAAQ